MPSRCQPRGASLSSVRAMSISTNQLKSGNHVEVDGTVYKVIEFQHVNPGKGAAFVRTKLRRASDGAVIDKTFRAGEKLRSVRSEARRMQFLYADGDAAHFMNTETYEQIELPEATLKDPLKWIKVNDEVEILFIDDQPSDVQVPGSVDLEVTQTDPVSAATPRRGAGPSRPRSRRASWFRFRCSSRPARRSRSTPARVDTCRARRPRAAPGRGARSIVGRWRWSTASTRSGRCSSSAPRTSSA